ncbi:hypothetical protein [Haloprofundus halobius]|uniref:hypothetical protein n=1 Tax=Haloprofundus halobius TaxID=2876194 RepID=UPI001CD007CB|nr:hypothetical protein [Haloprofundus halobius]
MSTASVSCTKCGQQFDVKTEYFQKFGSDPFCQDCLIHTECQSCKRGLRLQPSRYKELGGDPVVCTDCDQGISSSTTAGSSSGTSFWSGLTIGEKIVFPILLIAFVGILGIAAFAEMNGGSVETPLLLPILILLYWTYRRGKKNRSSN